MVVKNFGKNLATVYSAELEGINAKLIEVEIDINVGIHTFNIVGLADKALNEAKERVNSALKNSGTKPPNRENRKITINLAPADIKKTGSQYDLAIALGYLAATKQIKELGGVGKLFDDKLFLGELALDGRLRAVNGALNIAQMAADRGFKYLFLPLENMDEAAAIKTIKVVPIKNLRQAIDILEMKRGLEKATSANPAARAHKKEVLPPDFSEIKGQENAKRALMIAAAGRHNVLMTGPPGVGKSFLARAFAGILPELELDEAIEVTKIWSAAGLRPGGLIHERPFRAPHQTASMMALVGGGQDPKPGEISLAHRGILFLDELPEFQKNVLESLRQPMEAGFIQVSRAKSALIFPAKFTLVAAMNPCPCGYYGDMEKECKCSAYEVIKYQKRISGPLLDRIDLQIKLGRVKIEQLRKGDGVELQSQAIREAVGKAKEMQKNRFGGVVKTNAEMSSREVQQMIKLDADGEQFLQTLDRTHLSPRSYYRLLKVSRTIADLEGKLSIGTEELAEAFSYRLRELA